MDAVAAQTDAAGAVDVQRLDAMEVDAVACTGSKAAGWRRHPPTPWSSCYAHLDAVVCTNSEAAGQQRYPPLREQQSCFWVL